MTEEDKLVVQQVRGNAAHQELKVTGDAFVNLKKRYVDAWAASDPRDTAGREKLWVATTILSAVESQLRQYVADGKVADKELDRIRNAGQPKKILGMIPNPLRTNA